MAEFTDTDLTGSRFEHVDLTGARFENVDLSRATLRGATLNGATVRDACLDHVVMRGVGLYDVDIDGQLRNVTINGVDVVPLVEQELNRRYPDRALMFPTDAAGFRAAWDAVERLWEGTVERARRLDPALLHESVGGEWSFVETLRHLSFATDAWVRRARAQAGRRADRGVLGAPYRAGRRPGLAGVAQLRGTRVPARRPQRGVGAPALRRARPRCPRGRQLLAALPTQPRGAAQIEVTRARARVEARHRPVRRAGPSPGGAGAGR